MSCRALVRAYRSTQCGATWTDSHCQIQASPLRASGGGPPRLQGRLLGNRSAARRQGGARVCDDVCRHN
jgi:hypothetical protein